MSTTIIGKLSSSSSSPNNSNNNNNNNNNTNQLFNEENDNVSIPTAASNFSTSTTIVSASGTCAESGGEDSLSSSNIVNKPLSLSPTLATAAAATTTSTTASAAVVASSATTTTTNLPPQSLEQHCRLLEEENQKLKDAQAHLQQQYSEAQRREKILMRKLAHKEQELQDYVSQIAEYKSAQAPGPAALRATLLDPAVNIMFEKLKNELKTTKAKLEETQNELSAWKFTPDSNTGKRLMAKCRQLYQENEELGKMMSNGRLAKLEAELATQKKFSEEVKKCQTELDDYLQELDEDVEGMQSTIYFLQQELKATRDRIQILEKENNQLKNGETETDPDNESSEKSHQQNFILNGKTSGLLRTSDGIGVDGDEKMTITATTTMTKNELMNETFIERGEHDERTKKSSFSSSSGSSIHSNMNMNTVIVNTSNIMNSSDSNNSCNNNITNEEIVNIRTARNSSSDIRHNGNNDINCDDSNEIVIKGEGGNGDGDGDGDSFDCIDDSNNSGTVGGIGGVESGIGSVVSSGAGNNNNFMMKNTKQPPKKRNYDSDSSENSSTNDITIRNKIVKKKTRRSSVLSIDLNEEDTQIAEEDSEDDDEDEDNNSQRILTRRKSPRSLQSSDHN